MNGNYYLLTMIFPVICWVSQQQDYLAIFKFQVHDHLVPVLIMFIQEGLHRIQVEESLQRLEI